MSDKDFKLKSSSEGFDTRTKDIFANIDSLASTSKKQQNSEEKQKQPRKRITAPSPPPEDSSSRNSDQKKRTEEFKNCESIFRTPNESGWPPARSRHDRKRPHHGNQRFVFTNFWQLFFFSKLEFLSYLCGILDQ